LFFHYYCLIDKILYQQNKPEYYYLRPNRQSIDVHFYFLARVQTYLPKSIICCHTAVGKNWSKLLSYYLDWHCKHPVEFCLNRFQPIESDCCLGCNFLWLF